MNALIIAGITIIQDAHGRYNLNALHQASGSGEAKKPGNWTKRRSTQELQAELESQVSFLTLETVHGGERAGTYAHELLAVEYAGWISPAFRLKVNQAFIDFRTGNLPPVISPLENYPELKATYELILAVAEQREETAKLRAEQECMQGEISKSLDVAQMALRGQHWLTLRQYVYLHSLQAQLPLSRQRAYATFLTGYCQEKDLAIYEAMPADRPWKTENVYSMQAINDTLPGWLRRFGNQLSLDE